VDGVILKARNRRGIVTLLIEVVSIEARIGECPGQVLDKKRRRQGKSREREREVRQTTSRRTRLRVREGGSESRDA
jgi:hypothetical protein